MTRVAVVGATGYTGRLIVRELLARSMDVVAVGRSPEKLAALPPGADTRVADASDAAAVRRAIDGCAAVCSCVGPFVDHGEPTLAASVEAGVHYIDTTGEQAFMRTVFERYDAPAREAGIALVTAVGFDYVPGDMAAALAAGALGGRADAVDIAYLVTKAKSSAGTKRTGMRVAGMPCYVLRDGKLEGRSIGDDERRFTFPAPYGETNVALWPGGEPITVPRHTGARDVRVYMRMPKVAAAAARKAGLAAPVLRAGRAVVGSKTDGPSDEERARARYVVVAEARLGAGTSRCVLEGRDMYGMTAAACAEALRRLTDGSVTVTGAVAPSEAFEPAGFIVALPGYMSYRLDR